VISRGDYSGQTFVRNRGHIRRDHLDHCGVFVQATGTRVGIVHGQEMPLPAYHLQYFDLAQEEISSTSGGLSASIYMPRDLMESVIPDFSRHHAAVRSDPAARLLAQHLMVMQRYVPQIPEEQLPSFIESTLELVFTTLEHTPAPSIDTSTQQALLHRIEQFIELRVHDPELDPQTVATAFGLSRSALYRAFAGHGGVARYIKQRRLARAHHRLATSSDEVSVTSLVESFGYRSSAHFWRNFREEFGYAPGAARSADARDTDSETNSELAAIFRQVNP
jgi:AraC-like DNA-binding protein